MPRSLNLILQAIGDPLRRCQLSLIPFQAQPGIQRLMQKIDFSLVTNFILDPQRTEKILTRLYSYI